MSARRQMKFEPMAVMGVAALSLAGCVAAPQAPARETIQVTANVTQSPVEVSSSTPAPPAPPAAIADSPARVMPETFVMPDYRDWVLQDAQDDLQSVGSYVMNQEDATGTRNQLIDANWKVCSQAPAAGTTANIADIITLWSVKLAETCP